MAQQTINVGTVANDGTGDSLRASFTKSNSNFTELYGLGTSYQPLDADLTAIAALAGTNTIYYRSAANTWAAVTVGANLTFSAGTLSTTGLLTTAVAATTYQPIDGDLTAIAALAGTNTIYYRSAADTWSPVTIGSNLSFAAGTLNTATAPQPLDAELTAIAGLVSAADQVPYFTGAGTAALTTVTAAARSVLDDTTTAAMVTTLGAQPLDAELTAIAGLVSAADRVPYFTGVGTASLATFTAYGRSLVAAADAPTALTTLGAQPLDGDLTAIAALAGTNTIYYRSAVSTWSPVSLGATLTFSGGILDTAGLLTSTVAASTYQPLDGDLTSLAGAAGTNTIYYRSAANTWSAVTVGANLTFSAGTLNTAVTPQASDAELTAIAGLTSAADQVPYFTGPGTAALMTITPTARTVLDDTSTAAMLTTLGGQPLDAELTAIAGLVSAADRVPYFTGVGTAALMTVTAAARTLLDDTSTAAMLTTLGAQAAGNYQPLDADLTAISGLVSAADQVIYYTGAGTAALTTVTAAARTVLDDTTIGAMLTTLGGLSAATAATTYAPLASPTLTGVPVAPTAAVGTSTTQIATTAFVNNEAVAKAGDTMTGQLTVNVGAATGGVAIARAAGQQGQIPVYSGAIAGANLRWNMIFADSALEGGSNAGSNFALQRFSDVGAYLGSPLSITRSNGTIVLSGDTTVSSPTAWHTLALGGSANPAINLIPTSGATQQSYIGQSGDQLIFCNSGIANYMQLNLNSGAVTVNASPAVADNSTTLATTAYVKSNLASYLTTALATTTYVNATGDTMTGQLTVGPVTGAAVRYHNGTYGAFHWIDAANFHLLLTASGDPLGSYNTLRPFQVALSTGLVTIGNGLAVGGAFTAPTAATADNSTTVATTAYVQANLATGSLPTGSTSGYLLRTNGAGTASTWVGVLQGGTGAVTRTWESKARDVICIDDFGAVGNGSITVSGTGTSDTTAFVNAWTQANAVGGKVIVPAGNYRFATGYDFNTGTVFEFQSGAVICPDTGVTVYFRSPIVASPIRIFGNNGQIAGLADVWVEWFGAKGDDSTDCIGPLNRAHTCIANPGYISGTFSGRTTLRFGRGRFRVSSTWVVMPRVDFSLRILGCGSNLDGTRIVAMPSANITMMRVDGPVGMTANMDFEMRDMGFEVTDQNLAAPRCVCLQFNVSGDGRYILGGKESIIDNCYFFGQYCVIGWRLIKMLFSRCHFHTPNSAGQSFGVQLHGQKGTGSDWAGCDTVRFQYCHWQGTWNNPTMIGLYIQAENSVTAIQFDTCEWLAHTNCVVLQTATGATLADVWFKHCQFDDLRGSATAPASQGKAIDMQCVGVSLLCDIHILNCYMTNVQNNGFYISCISDTADRINSVFVKGNYNAGCIGRAMQLYRCSTISVEGNIFSGVTADYAIYMLGIHYSLVANNGFGQAGNNLVGSFSNCVSIQSDCSGNQVHHNLGAGRNSGVSVYDGGTGNQCIYNT